jgi:hypothetical protein
MNIPNLASCCHAIRSGVTANALSRLHLTTIAADPMLARKALLLHKLFILTMILLFSLKNALPAGYRLESML